MSDIGIILHGMEETEYGTAICDQTVATSWCVFVHQYLPGGGVEILEDEDFATYAEALARVEELQLKYPGADFEEL